MKKSLRQFLYSTLLAIPCFSFGQHAQYEAKDGAIVGDNTGRYNNRPLYINNTNAFILTGDQPIARLAKEQYLYGSFMLAIERKGTAKWLQECDQITSFYRAGKMAWEISDAAFPGLKVELEVLPITTGTGMAIHVVTEGALPDDQLIWVFGGAQWQKGEDLSWKLDLMGHPELLTWDFIPQECHNNLIETNNNLSFVSVFDEDSNNNKLFTVAISCSAPTKSKIGSASVWQNPTHLNKSSSSNLPILKGTIAAENGKSIYWAFEAFNQPFTTDFSSIKNPKNLFTLGKKRIDAFEERLKINTPDPYLNAIAKASVAAIDGTWYPPVFHHGAMQWNVRFPGWRTIFGGIMYGWHDRVKQEAKFYTDSQIKESDKKEAKADRAFLLTQQALDSRFYGVGRIAKDQAFYNMQSQFFDQLVEEYRWTADPELIAFFREALELHLIWIRDCFDPDGDGIYESYINSWPSDSQWYNGGGSAEETSYAYRGHLAARDMAKNASDISATNYHNKMLRKIKTGFFKKLWITEKGHSGSYREQGGHGRLHTNPWLYSIFLPIDSGLTSHRQSIESLYYTEWALQNDYPHYGGRQVWTSNWVPGIWSVRELWPGDNYHLALSYFQAGLPNDGYDIFKGTYLRTAFNHLSPGNFGGIQCGIDFGDCTNTFARTLVSGLFGYRPDYPNEKVKIAPQFPSDWNHASIEIPDFKIAFSRVETKINYTIGLTRTTNIELQLPIQSKEIENVTVNGKNVIWKLVPGVGCSLVQINLANATKAEVSIELGESLPYYAPVTFKGNIGDELKIDMENAKVIKIIDPQQVLASKEIENNIIVARLADNKGNHTVIAEVKTGGTPQFRVFRITINDPIGDARKKEQFIDKLPSKTNWKNIDVSTRHNAQITDIYKQDYLTPRPSTVSVRLGSDGYSPWTFLHWKNTPPEIKLSNVITMLDNTNKLWTPQGVPFIWNSGDNNIAFTSMWDNYPRKIDFPIKQKGDAIFFLISGSTNVMQCQISNATIRLDYANGQTDSLELIPPVNYWNLSKITAHASAPGQLSRSDYNSEIDWFPMPDILPETVQLGENCRAMLLNLKMRRGIELKSVTLETLSQEVVVGLIGISIMNPE